MDHIVRNFYIGDEEDSKNIELLKEKGIRCIVNCALECKNYYPGIFWYLNLPLDDPDPALESFFGTILNQLFIVKDIPTLIHCKKGVSRSVTALTYFLSKALELPSEEVIKKIQECRSQANPHPVFREILKKNCG